MTSSMIFYTGVGLMAAGLLGLCGGLMAIKIKSLSLRMRLDEEYGKEDKDKNKDKGLKGQ